jgi:hypothetical protein
MSGRETDRLDALVRANDLDGLVRLVQQWCDEERWDDLLRLRERCRREATDTGRQLWPAAALAEYRLALQGPASVAAAMVLDASGRFVAGPLTEVAAARHAWRDLAPHLGGGPPAGFVAHERVLRGEDLRGQPVDPAVLEMPLVLLPWEPAYALAEYGEDDVSFPPPPAPSGLASVVLPTPGPDLGDDDAIHALRELALAWLTGSEASLAVRAVDGDELQAVATLLGGEAVLPLADSTSPVPAAEVAVGPLTPDAAIAWLAWVGATGGVHGRRRGAATGRFGAWWVAASLAGLDWPDLPPGAGAAAGRLEFFGRELGAAVQELHWWWWEPIGATAPWALRLAVLDPLDEVAWAIELVDRA